MTLKTLPTSLLPLTGNKELNSTGVWIGIRSLIWQIEVDETYSGGKEKNKHQRQKPKKLRWTLGKQAVIGTRERGGKTKAKPISSTDRASLWQD